MHRRIMIEIEIGMEKVMHFHSAITNMQILSKYGCYKSTSSNKFGHE